MFSWISIRKLIIYFFKISFINLMSLRINFTNDDSKTQLSICEWIERIWKWDHCLYHHEALCSTSHIAKEKVVYSYGSNLWSKNRHQICETEDSAFGGPQPCLHFWTMRTNKTSSLWFTFRETQKSNLLKLLDIIKNNDNKDKL